MADHFSTLQQQFALKAEASPGVVETLAVADVQLRPATDLSFQPDYGRNEFDEVSDDLAKSQDYVAGLRGGFPSVGLVMKGSGVVGTAPALGRHLRACGLKEEVVRQIAIGSVAGGAGGFVAGDIITTGAKTVKVDVDTTGTLLRYIQVSGGDLTDSDVVTASDSDAATCSGSSSAFGVRYTPRSTGHETFTMQSIEKNVNGTSAQDFIYRIKGAMGTARIEATALAALRFVAEYSGCKNFTGAGSFFTGVTYETATPAATPKFLNATIQVGGVTVVPSAFTLDLGNDVVLDPDPSTGGGASGYDYARILGRNPTITIDPRHLKPGDLDIFGKHEAGDVIAFAFTSSGAAGQIIELTAKNLQITALGAGNRANLRTAELTLAIRRAAATDEDFKLYFR